MIHFRDMTFCCAKNCQNKCGRQITDEIRAAAERWWGGKDAPLSLAVFCDENGEVIEKEPGA